MGEELKESKFYFKTSNDDSEWKEVSEIKNIDISLKEPEFSDYIAKQIKSFSELEECEKMVFGFVTNAILNKEWKKMLGLSHLSKKRTRKLLMAHGFDRNTAQMYADTMYPRNITEIEKITLILEKEGKVNE